MQVQSVGGSDYYQSLRIRDVQSADGAGAATAAGVQSGVSGSSSAITTAGATVSTQSVTLAATETSFASRVSSLVAEFGPAVTNEDLLRLLLLMIALELLSRLNGENGEVGGTLVFTGGSSRSGIQSIEITQSSSSVNYALSVYNQHSQGYAAPSPSGSVVEPGPADDPGRNLDFQA